MPFENLHVVSRGVDTRLFSPSRRSPGMRQAWGAGEHGIVAICVGRMAPEKIFRLPSGRFWQCTSEFRGQRKIPGHGALAFARPRCGRAPGVGNRGRPVRKRAAQRDRRAGRLCLSPPVAATSWNSTRGSVFPLTGPPGSGRCARFPHREPAWQRRILVCSDDGVVGPLRRCRSSGCSAHGHLSSSGDHCSSPLFATRWAFGSVHIPGCTVPHSPRSAPSVRCFCGMLSRRLRRRRSPLISEDRSAAG